MSKHRKHEDRKMCQECGQRKAVHRQPSTGKYIWSDDHDLCQCCYRKRRDRDQARLLGRAQSE